VFFSEHSVVCTIAAIGLRENVVEWARPVITKSIYTNSIVYTPGEVQSNQKSNPKFVTVTRQNVTNYSNRITKTEK